MHGFEDIGYRYDEALTRSRNRRSWAELGGKCLSVRLTA
jgi:hypothetical protein